MTVRTLRKCVASVICIPASFGNSKLDDQKTGVASEEACDKSAFFRWMLKNLLLPRRDDANAAERGVRCDLRIRGWL